MSETQYFRPRTVIGGETSRTDLNMAINYLLQQVESHEIRLRAVEGPKQSPSEDTPSEGIWCGPTASQESSVSTEPAREDSNGPDDGDKKLISEAMTKAAFDSQRNANRLAMATEFAVAFIARTQPGMASDEVVYALADRALTLADTIIDRVEDKGDE